MVLSEFTALTVVVMLVIKSISLESESDTRVSSDISICLTVPCGLCGLFDLRHTFAKWLRPPQLRQFVPHAGHFSFLGACSPPQNRHVFRFYFGSRGLPLLGALTRESRCRILFTSSVSVPKIASSRELVASVLRQMSMHLVRVSFLS